MKAPSLASLRLDAKARIKLCESIIGYRFRNPKYIKEALTTIGSSNNQRMALLGDKVLDSQLAARWYDDKQRPAGSQWQLVRNVLASNMNLAQVCLRLRIQDCTLTSCSSGRGMATTVEAIIAAVWLDSKRDYGAVNAVMERLSLTKHALIRSPKTTFTANQPRCDIQDIQSSRSLPDRFFVGHHLGLIQLLFRHSQSFFLRQHAGQHGNLSRYEPAREAATERQPIGMWSRLKNILSAPQIMPETDQKRTAAAITRKHKNRHKEASASDTTNTPRRQAPALGLAIGEQTNAEHDDSALDSTLPVQQPPTLGDQGRSLDGRHDEPTGWYSGDTEWRRIYMYIWSVIKDKEGNFPDRETLVAGLKAHREVLRRLPGRSLKNRPDGFSTSGVYLMTDSANEFFDKLLALQALDLHRKHDRLLRLAKRRRSHNAPIPPEKKASMSLLESQLTQIWIERLKLWLPQDAHQDQIPVSLPKSDQTPASPSETPQSGSPATAAVDLTTVSTAEPLKHKRPHQPGSILWTTHTARHKAVNWKQYLSRPTTENQQRT